MNNPPQMTPNDKLPEEIQEQIKADAKKYMHSEIKGMVGDEELSPSNLWYAHIAGATAWAPWKVQCNEPTIEQMNEVIALFDGLVKCNNSQYLYPHYRDSKGQFKGYAHNIGYDTCWDTLMPVVEKIEHLDNRRYGFAIEPTSVIVSDLDRKEGEEQIIWVHEYPDNGDTKLSMTYDAVYQFITWYNQQKQNDEYQKGGQ